MTVLVFRDGATRKVEAVDPAWLRDDAAEIVWVDIQGPGRGPTSNCLSNTFHFQRTGRGRRYGRGRTISQG
jgi:hypothetical protein